jgi:hypothetical protein
MAAPLDAHGPDEQREIDAAAFRKQGAVAGLFGAMLLAAWFLYVDVVQGHPLFTPTLLANALFWRGAAPAAESLQGSMLKTVLFTALHALVFVLIGLGGAEVLLRFARVRSRALLALLLFGMLCVVFFAFALNVAAMGPQGVAVRDALIGNAIAAFGMAAYLARNLP